MTELNKLWYKVAKSAVGAVFNVQSNIVEVILGVPSLNVTSRVLTVKHYLKALCRSDGNIHRQFISKEIDSGNVAVMTHMRDVQQFLKWKAEVYPETFNPNDTLILEMNDMTQLPNLSRKACHYTKGSMRLFTELIWQECINNQLMMEGWTQIPKVSTTPLQFPSLTNRDVEVLVMSMFYKNNLLNGFLFSMDRLRWNSPLCSCGYEEQTAIHVLTNWILTEENLRDQAAYYMNLANDASNLDELGTVTILNCSRDLGFIRICCEIVENSQLQLRRKISLPKSSSSTSSTQA
jgi:hypothetical protein